MSASLPFSRLQSVMSHSSSAASVALSPSLVLLLEQLTSDLSGESALSRLDSVFQWLKELLAYAILTPSALHNPTSASLPHHSPPALPPADSPVKRTAPSSSPPAAATSFLRSSPAPSSSPLSASAAAPTAGVSVSHPTVSSPGPAAANTALMCELLQLCYIETLARPRSVRQSPLSSPSELSDDELPVPPSAASLSLVAFLTAHPHFASTSSFRSLLSLFVRQCGVVFLLHVADRLHCLSRALSFIACHALPHVNSACVAFIVAREHCTRLLTSAAGSHIFRSLPSHQQLEVCIMTILTTHHATDTSPTAAPHTATVTPTADTAQPLSPLTVMSHLWDLIPALDSHSLYRLCTLLDPTSNAVSPAAVDSHSRIVMCELFLYALCRIRYKAEQDSLATAQPHQAQQQHQASEVAVDEEDEELTFYTSASLHAALLRHRRSYRVWLILAVLNDLCLYEAAAVLYESAEQWVDALEARLRHITTQHRRTHNTDQQYSEERHNIGTAILALLQSHVAHVPTGPEQARALALVMQTWRGCNLPSSQLEAQLIHHMDDIADSLSILAFTQEQSTVELSPPLPDSSAAHIPLSFSPVVLLHLTRHRLHLLQQSHMAAASVSLGSPAASPRQWHDIRQRLHAKVGRRQMAEIGGVSSMSQLTDYRRDAIMTFTCGHSHVAFDMAESSIPQLTHPNHTQYQQKVVAAVTRQYERAQRDGGVVQLACPACVTMALSGQQQQQQQQRQSQQWTTRSKAVTTEVLAGIDTPNRDIS